MIPLAVSSPLLRMLVSSVLATVAVSLVFSLAVYGVIRASDMRRVQRSQAAAAYAVLAVAGLLGAAGCVVFGLALMAQKS